MSKLKFLIGIVIALLISFGVFVYYKYRKVFDYAANIEVYSELLSRDPNNCFYNEQMAVNYSFLNKFDEAINYYEIALTNCPEYLTNLFQLGVIHYLKGNKEIGLKFMDKAIEKAKEAEDKELELVFRKEKSDWIRKVGKDQ